VIPKTGDAVLAEATVAADRTYVCLPEGCLNARFRFNSDTSEPLTFAVQTADSTLEKVLEPALADTLQRYHFCVDEACEVEGAPSPAPTMFFEPTPAPSAARSAAPTAVFAPSAAPTDLACLTDAVELRFDHATVTTRAISTTLPRRASRGERETSSRPRMSRSISRAGPIES